MNRACPEHIVEAAIKTGKQMLLLKNRGWKKATGHLKKITITDYQINYKRQTGTGGYDQMKHRLMKLGAIFMASLVTVLGSGVTSTYGATIRAGVSAAVEDYLGTIRAVAQQTQKNSGPDSGQKGKTKNVETTEDQAKAKEQKNKKEDKKEVKNSKNKDQKEKQSGTICGYKNLGIASVDNYLNVRQEPGEDAKVIGKLPSDAGCEIVDTKDGWYQIRSGKVSGYVKSDYIVTGRPAEKLAEKLKRTMATVNSMTVYIREKPNTDCTILTIVTEDEELEVVKEGKDWVEVRLDNENGYVNAKYVELSEELKKAMVYTETERSADVPDTKYTLVQTALSYVGNPYVWGGESLTNGVDCSGFTMQIMAKYGIYLPHLASAQAGYGTSVSTSQLQPGDLIFYGSGGSITHVAIYIGNGQIVHASNSRDGIKVSNAFYRTPVCCRRMF